MEGGGGGKAEIGRETEEAIVRKIDLQTTDSPYYRCGIVRS